MKLSFTELSVVKLSSALKLSFTLLSVSKLSSTYISNYIDGEVGGRIYPFFNLNKVRTYRSSSDSPNFQNVPNNLAGLSHAGPLSS